MEKSVYEYASMLGITNERMIDILWEMGINVESYLDKVDDSVIRPYINNYILRAIKSYQNNSSLKEIKIYGLFNKKDYSIKFDDSIKILIAENGSGKTTILNIIIATLKGQAEKLRRLPFESVEIKIGDETFAINKRGLLVNGFSIMEKEEMFLYLRKYLPKDIYISLRREFDVNNFIDLDLVLKYIKKYSVIDSMDYKKLRCMVYDNYREINEDDHKDINSLNRIRELVEKEEEVIYFPTYRRVEDEFENVFDMHDRDKDRFISKINKSSVNFGIADVELEINRLTDKLRYEAADYYTKMSADILNDLLSNKFNLNRREKKKINIEKIDIVIGRIGEGKIKDVDKLRQFIINDSDDNNAEFLMYFIHKLLNIYEKQKPTDDKIKTYIDVCNKYLSNKSMIYDEVTVRVYIVDSNDGEEIKFKHLSSGEKQILSLFAKLYLMTTKPCIFVIDEPELSLSILWQKMLIMDIYKSNRVKLLITTTHSPFIFKNEYSIFARELDEYRRR